MENEYDGIDEEDEDIKWRNLDPKQRAKFLRLIFEDDDWYDGTPFYLGGDTNPDFQTVCDRSGAPMSEVKRYYASWLNKQGFDPKRAQELEKPQGGMQAQPSTQQIISNATSQPAAQQPMMQTPDHFNEPDPMEDVGKSNVHRKRRRGNEHGGYDGILDLATKNADATTAVSNADDDATAPIRSTARSRYAPRTNGQRSAVHEPTNHTSS